MPNPFPAPGSILPLWNRSSPHGQGTIEKDTPTLAPFLPGPSDRPGPALLICPGGGYQVLAIRHEGLTIAEWFRDRGIAAFVLRYRLPGEAQAYRHPVPLLDAQRAIRLIRARAAAWNIDPRRVAVMGFSAGGHLASTVATHFDSGDASATDPIDRQSSRPDFAVLVYPVISLQESFAHTGSRDSLLGPDANPALLAHLSSETQVTAETPPTLLIHSLDDSVVPIQNSRVMLAALQKAGVPCAFHEYPTGEHGFGYDPADPASNAPSGWLERTYDWLAAQGWTTRPT